MDTAWSVSNVVLTSELVIAIAISIPAFASIFHWLRRSDLGSLSSTLSQRYEDEDGEASIESTRAFADRLQRAVFVCCASIGSTAAFTRYMLMLDAGTSLGRMAQVGIWSCLMLQSLALLTEPSAPVRFSLALQGSANCINIICALFLEFYTMSNDWNSLDLRSRSLEIVELITAGLACFHGILLPRRPDVFWKGLLVDQQFTSSWFRRSSFSWAWSALRVAPGRRTFGIDELPELDRKSRSSYLFQRFQRDNTGTDLKSPLWKILAYSYRYQLLRQLALTIIGSVLSFAPQIMLLSILHTMETEKDDDNRLVKLAPWTCGLGLSILTSACIGQWNVWFSSMELGMKMQNQLIAVTFDKLLRSQGPGLDKLDEPEEDDKSSITAASGHNITNLITTDAQQAAACVRGIYRGYEALIKLVIASLLIERLMGYQSFIVGTASVVLLLATNLFIANRQSYSQRILMARKDSRMAIVTEALQAVRQIKFSGCEDMWESSVSQERKKELDAQWNVNQWTVAAQTLYTFGPILISVVVLAMHVYISGDLKASTAFTFLSALGEIESSLGAIPELQSNWLGASISLKRLQNYLQTPERHLSSTVSDQFTFEQATIRWPGQAPGSFQLSDLTFSFPLHSISVIEGPSQSGKSLLLAAILGECDVIHGSIKRPLLPPHPYHDTAQSAIAYVAQTPWIENATVTQNILFGLPMQLERYHNVLHACALSKDLAGFAEGDRTEIGPKGVNLSGGQRSRIALARALYSRASTLVMDDIFSAVDAHTAQHLCKYVLSGSLVKGRTIILATHHLSLCAPYADYIVSLGSNAKCETKLACSDSIYAPSDEQEIQEEVGETCIAVSEDDTFSTSSSTLPPSRATVMITRKYVEDEEQRTVGSKHWILLHYLRQIGNIWFSVSIVLIYIGYVGFVIAKSYWIAYWAHQNATKSNLAIASVSNDNLSWYLSIYTGISVLACVAGTLRYYFTLSSAMCATRKLFASLLHSVLHAKLDFLDRSPPGRLLNRFSSDIAVLDNQVGQTLGGAFMGALELLAILSVGTTTSWWILLISIVMLILVGQGAYQFYGAARTLKYLDSITRSPILERFSSTIDGLQTIRAFGAQESYHHKLTTEIDCNARAVWNLWLVNSWFGYRMGLLGAVFVTVATFVIISIPNITVAMTGFGLSFILRYTGVTATFIRGYVNLELALTSIDRVQEYSQLPSERYDGRSVPAAWPEQGLLTVSHLVVRYSPYLPPALDGINFQLLPNQRIGVVGRTGAGKSSLAMALFRFLEAEQGSVTLDGIDISTVPLQQLRQRLAIIPQDPQLFSGTIRTNLDPFNTHDDTELLDALNCVHWVSSKAQSDHESVASCSELHTGSSQMTLAGSDVDSQAQDTSPLDLEVVDGGRNLSKGQRQQICLARAIASRPKILIMDEATSSIDQYTDAMIQKSMRESFGRGFTSLLVIAHRVSTVMDFDRILVLDKGKVKEFGSPQELMQRVGGHFRMLVEDTG